MEKQLTIAERTQLEMEEGRKVVALFAKLQGVDDGVKLVHANLPNLWLNTLVNKPYTEVSVTVQHLKTKKILHFIVPVEGFPSDHFIAQLALIA